MRWTNRALSLADELSRLRSLKPHELLSINADASRDEIKRAYRALAKVYHPDKADPFMRNHNEQVIKLINAAYRDLLSLRRGVK